MIEYLSSGAPVALHLCRKYECFTMCILVNSLSLSWLVAWVTPNVVDMSLMPLLTGTLSEMPQGLEESKSPLRIPKMQQVLEWLSLLFDAHIQSLHRQPGSAQVRCSLYSNHVYNTSLDTNPVFW